jgi:hypothetical protein
VPAPTLKRALDAWQRLRVAAEACVRPFRVAPHEPQVSPGRQLDVRMSTLTDPRGGLQSFPSPPSAVLSTAASVRSRERRGKHSDRAQPDPASRARPRPPRTRSRLQERADTSFSARSLARQARDGEACGAKERVERVSRRATVNPCARGPLGRDNAAACQPDSSSGVAVSRAARRTCRTSTSS